MKRILLAVLLMTLTSLVSAQQTNKAIYGSDNRIDAMVHPNPIFKKWAKATAAKMDPSTLKSVSGSDRYSIAASSIGDSMGLCSEERFLPQPMAADCSGFLISDRLLVTAGHCMQSNYDCQSKVWVFDFFANDEFDRNVEVAADDVYRCNKVVKHALTMNNDYAVIELDRSVADREPLEVRRDGRVSRGEPLVVIGYPSGLPAKVSDEAIVTESEHSTYFKTNLDTFGGNSGSAVINIETGLVEGILVRGSKDYSYDYQRSCTKAHVCTSYSCDGEEVTRITEIFK